MKIDADVLKVNQLVEIYLSRSLRGKHYHSRIEEITPNHIVLAMPFDKGLPVIVSVGSPIYCKIVTDSSPYLFVCKYIDKKMTTLPIWLVSLPEEVIKIQQREYVRIDAQIHATIKPFDPEDELPPAKLIIGDISGGGLRLVAPRPYPIGKKIIITFELPDHEVIETIGEIVRQEQPQPDRPVYWLGVKYIGMRENQRNKIIRFIFQKQLDRHRRGF